MLSGKSLAAIVAPEVAGSRPGSHPTYSLAVTYSFLWLFSLALLFGGALGSFSRHRAKPHGATVAGYRLVCAVVRQGSEE